MADAEKNGTAGKKSFSFADVRVPHTYVIIFSMIIFAAVLTYLVPAGSFDRIKNEAGSTVVDAASFRLVEPNRATLMTVFDAIPKGMKSTAGLIFFVFIVGGVFQIINGTGVIDIGISKLVRTLSGREQFVIPIFLFTFSLGGALIGMSNETLVFVPIGIALARKVGYDALVGTSMVTLGAAAGFCAGTMNPFNVGVAQSIAELPLFSGIGLRLVTHVILLAIASFFIVRYAKRVKANPEAGFVYSLEQQEALNRDDVSGLDLKSGGRHVWVSLGIACGFGYIIYGVFKYEWGTDQMASVFLAMGIVCGLLSGMRPSAVAREFVEGAKALAFGALVIGIARGILVVLQDGMVLDTIVYGMATQLQKLPPQLTVIGMYLMHIILNFFIPSGSGQAAATMPLLIPVADMTGIKRQIAVLAFQFGDGFTNSINPTSSNMNAYLSIAKITYPQWARFAGPIIGSWMLVGGVILLVAQVIGYGPF